MVSSWSTVGRWAVIRRRRTRIASRRSSECTTGLDCRCSRSNWESVRHLTHERRCDRSGCRRFAIARSSPSRSGVTASACGQAAPCATRRFDQAIERLADSFREAGKIADDIGLLAAFEIEPPFVFNKEEHLQQILEQLAGLAGQDDLRPQPFRSHERLAGQAARDAATHRRREHRLCASDRL